MKYDFCNVFDDVFDGGFDGAFDGAFDVAFDGVCDDDAPKWSKSVLLDFFEMDDNLGFPSFFRLLDEEATDDAPKKDEIDF